VAEKSKLKQGNLNQIDGRVRHFDGAYRWFLFRATRSCEDDGRVVKWFGTTDRKRAESFPPEKISFWK